MSFAKTVKEELVGHKSDACCKLAEVSAMLHINSELEISQDGMSVSFQSANPTIAKRFLILVKELYHAEVELLTKKETKLNRRNLYIIQILDQVKQIVSEHGLFNDGFYDRELLTQKDCCKSAYLKGAFLSSGSVNDPIKPDYHLEMFTSSKEEAIFLQRLMNNYELNAKITRRRQGLIVYLKDAEKIADFLNIIGANVSVFKYEDIRIKRDFNNSINRVMNCEIANEKKILDAANQQIKDIKLIERTIPIDKIDSKTYQLMQLRKKHKEASLKDLQEAMMKEHGITISKSGLNHRFIKIKEMAQTIKENQSKPS